MRPLLIAHRGASGLRPEHTLAAYRLAAEQGADYLEPDLVLTRDGELVARHENEIGETTDVSSRPAYAARRRTQRIDGHEVTGWFTEDFTLAELRGLRARERLPDLRPGSAGYDGQFQIPTFSEILALASEIDQQRAAAARNAGQPVPAPIGIYPETKHPSHFLALGLDFEPALLEALERAGRTGPDAAIYVQSFEVTNLRRLHARCAGLPLVQLVAAGGGPADQPGVDYAAMLSPSGLAAIAAYADAIGPDKSLVVPRLPDGTTGHPTSLVSDAHAAGLAVHAWTFRAENHFLPLQCRRGGDPAALGDLGCELELFLAAGIDGLFTDHPGVAAAAIEAWSARAGEGQA
ncbi:MAG: hypothetical protein JJT85_01300 [Chromatiales bacterium]|nr:hypothetical protein [Chromatiales bacterium]